MWSLLNLPFPHPSSLTITKILLTHAHCDHVKGLAETKRQLPNAEIIMHHLETENLKAAPLVGPVSCPHSRTSL